MVRRRLQVVSDEPAAAEAADDIYAAVRAKRARIDWSRLHIRGDRAEPVFMPDRPRGRWRLRQLFSFERDARS